MPAVKKRSDLDFARVTAMFAVIMIHVTSTYVYAESHVALGGMNLAFLLNQMSQFAVPLFVLLSGASLGLSTSQYSPGAFYRKRLAKLLPPYLIWCLLYYFYNPLTNTLRPLDLSPHGILALLRTLLLGQAASHLYFIPVIFQCYLLYPLLKKWLQRAPGAVLLVAFALTFATQELYFLLDRQVSLPFPGLHPYLWMLFPAWGFYFVLGALLTGARLDQLSAFARHWRWLVLPVVLLLALLFAKVSFTTGFIIAVKPDLTLYVPLILLGCLSAWQVLRPLPFALPVVRFLADHSLTTYFSHVMVLNFFRRNLFFAQGMQGMVLLYLCVAVVSILLAFCLDHLLAWLRSLRSRPAVPV